MKSACASLPDVRYVYHLAAAMPPNPTDVMWRVNVEGTVTLLLGLARRKSLRFLNVGSAAQYLPLVASRAIEETDPCGGVNAYGRSKWTQELAAFAIGQELGIEIIATRTFNLVGPGLPSTFVAGTIVEQIKAARRNPAATIKLGKLFAERDFLDVHDAVIAYELLARIGQAGRAYNVCSRIPTSISTLARVALKLGGVGHDVESHDNRVRHDEVDCVYGNNERLQRETAWSMRVTLEDSISSMLST